MRIRKVTILLLGIIWIMGSILASAQSSDLKDLKEIAKAVKAHRALINTGEGKVYRFWKDIRYVKPVERHGQWWLKDNRWRYDFEGFQWDFDKNPNGSVVSQINYQTELRDRIALDFRPDKDYGIIQENLLLGRIRGLYLMGITGYNSFNLGVETLIELVQEGKAAVHSLEDVEFESKPCKLITLRLLNKEGALRGYSKLWICPEQQYSLIHHEVWLSKKEEDASLYPSKVNGPIKGNTEINNIVMEYISPPGIWFPKEAHFRSYASYPERLTSECRWIFSNTRLNIPISDDEITVTIPPGSSISDMINGDKHYIKEKTTLGEILSGKIESFDEEKLKGDRSATILVLDFDGAPVRGTSYSLVYFDRRFGSMTIARGVTQNDGSIQLKDLAGGKDAPEFQLLVDGIGAGRVRLTGDAKERELLFKLPPRTGHTAPEIALLDAFTSQTMKLSDFQGQVVLLFFWGTFCGPCHPAMARLNEMLSRQKTEWEGKVAFLAVSLDQKLSSLRKHIKDNDWQEIRVLWSPGWKSEAARTYGITDVPTVLLIDKAGNIVYRGHPTGIRESNLDKLVMH